MARSAYSVHGISVLVEYPHLLTAPLRRASHETWLQQERGTFNWFHFTTATPTQENGADVLLNGFGLNGGAGRRSIGPDPSPPWRQLGLAQK